VIGLLFLVGLVVVVLFARRAHVDMGETAARYAFLAFFAFFTAGAIAWLLVGLVPAFADAFPSFQDALFDIGEGRAYLPAWVEDSATRAAKAAEGVHDEFVGLEGRQPPGLIALEYVFSAVNIALAVFLVWLRPRDWAARLLAIGMVGTGAVYNLQSHASGEILPPLLVENTHDNFHLLSGVCYVVALMLFPDGRFMFHLPQLQGAQRVAVSVLAVLLPLVALQMGLIFHGSPEGFVAFFGVLIPIAGVASQWTRFRHAQSAQERQQSRLLLLALGFVFVVAVVFAIPALVLSEGSNLSEATRDEISRVLFRAFPPLFAIIPVTLFLVMVRYRLWDVDRVINRAVVYGVLTSVLALAYFAGIVLLQLLFRPLTGGSELAIVSTTLVVAALFRPVRTRVQMFVDRAFYRQRYDAARTLDAFATRIRDEVDLDALRVDLIAVAQETMQPAHVSLWLAPTAVRAEADDGDRGVRGLRNAFETPVRHTGTQEAR